LPVATRKNTVIEAYRTAANERARKQPARERGIVWIHHSRETPAATRVPEIVMR
jgi:hypothetical protein